MREFGCAAKASVAIIEHSEGAFDDLLNRRGRELATLPCKRLGVANRVFHQPSLLNHVEVLLPKSIRDGDQHAPEARPSVVIARREVGSAVERFAIGSEKAGQWPTSLAADRLHRDLVA